MIKKFLPLLVIFAMVICSVQTAIAKNEEIEKKINKIISKMSLEEKIGQMTQLTIDVLGDNVNGKFVINDAKLYNVIARYKVGSILNAPGTLPLSRAEWFDMISRIQKLSLKEIGIPCVYGVDYNHGTSYALDGTLFPQNINIGASFDVNMPYKLARIAAYEIRACNCPWTFSPTVDLSRDPRWPRVWENFGEDCLVNLLMGSAAVRGFQGNDNDHISSTNVATSVKHYMGYGLPRTGKDRTPAYISISDLREKCFAPFKACVDSGALTLMVNSGSINGVPVHANYELLTQWLKDDLKWDGVLVSDWSDINNLYTREHIAKDKKEAIQIAINAGIDMSMDPYNLNFCTLLKELVLEGKVKMSRIDDAVRRVLRLKYRLNLFEAPNTCYKDYSNFGSKANAEVAINAAEESEVLLKNKDEVLPIPKGTKILLTGPNANSMRCLNGGWSYTWQGHLADRYAVKYNTIYEALCNKFGKENVVLEQGVTYKPEGAYYEENVIGIEKAVAASQNTDIIVACIGENSYCETPGNLSDLAMSDNQRKLVKALATAGKPIVLIINSGRPRLINDIEPLAKGVVDILLPGNYGGDALANILSGEVNPCAKMPYTYPRSQAELFNYDYRVSEEMDKMEGAYDYDAVVSVQWPFGYGLSYTNFTYSNFNVDKKSFKYDDELHFTVDVTNSGKVAGKEVVMLYSRDMVASLTPENRRLRAFEKIELKPGETKTVSLTIKGSDLAFVGADGKWILEQGDFRMQAGNKVLNINCVENHKWLTNNK